MSVRRSFALVLTLLLAVGVIAIQSEDQTVDANASRVAIPSITLSPGTAVPNQPIAVHGYDFTTLGQATLMSIEIDGLRVQSSRIND